MKTLQEFYEEVKANDELKRGLSEAVRAGKVTEFLKVHGYDSTADELKEFVADKVAQDRPVELIEEGLEMVAGGKIHTFTGNRIEQTDVLAGNIEGGNLR